MLSKTRPETIILFTHSPSKHKLDTTSFGNRGAPQPNKNISLVPTQHTPHGMAPSAFTRVRGKIKIKIKIKTVYCHVASTWNLDVVAYIIHTYIHIHKYTYLHTYILTHKVNLGMQSLRYHKTPSLKIYRYVKNKS